MCGTGKERPGTGLPPSIRIVTGVCNLLRQRAFAERAKVMHLPYMRIASEMVDYLLSDSKESIVRKGKCIIQPPAEFIEETRFQ